MKAAVIATLREMASGLQSADLADVIQEAMVKVETCGVRNACRYALADWFQEQSSIPTPTEDSGLSEAQYLDTGKRRGRHGEMLQRTVRTVRREIDGAAGWKAMFARATEKERSVAVRLAAGWSTRDIAADLGIAQQSAQATIKRLRTRLADVALWHPILDVLFSIPDTLIGRGEYDTDLTAYRSPRCHVPVLVRDEKRPTQVHGWKLSPADTVLVQPTTRLRIRAEYWYPGCPVFGWSRSVPTWQPTMAGAEYRVLTYDPDGRSEYAPDLIAFDGIPGRKGQPYLKPRELSGLTEGQRWFFRRADGWYLSSPVIRRDLDTFTD
jgi:DNA-binding CsgD family transcriptional regulator